MSKHGKKYRAAAGKVEAKAYPLDEAVRIALDVCEALAEPHAMGIVHGALKPGNILLATDESAGAPTIKVLDFGMPSPIDPNDEQSGATWFASPVYLAPEQILDPGRPSPRVDIWAIGVILHELLSGASPFVSGPKTNASPTRNSTSA